MSYRRIVTVVALAAALGAASTVGAGSASAGPVGGGGKPSPRVFVESGLPFTYAAGDACPFAVTLSEVANNEFSRTFPNGNMLITGRFVVAVKNDATGKSVVRNISGPVLITSGPNGETVVVLNGSSLSAVFAGHDDTGTVGQGLFIFHGPTVFTDFQLTRVSGAVENLCTTLS